MFDESFFVAVSFFTVIGAFIYLKLPSKLMQALDEKSAEIAKELDDAKALRAEAEKVLADYEDQRKQAEAQAEKIIAEAKNMAEKTLPNRALPCKRRWSGAANRRKKKSPVRRKVLKKKCAPPFPHWRLMRPRIWRRRA